ncbi:hypothetical protein ACLESO_25430 [Pyxidicoccus sp. 3LG]
MRLTSLRTAVGVLCALLVCACATDPAFTEERAEGGEGWGNPAEAAGLGFTRDGGLQRLVQDEAALHEARRAEAERVVRELWDIAGARATPGETWRFEYQSHGGALTLLAFHRLSGGSGPAVRDASWSAFEKKLGRGLPTLLGEAPKRVIFTLEREVNGWDVDLDAESGEGPPQTRRLPVVLPRAPEPVWSLALHEARKVLRAAPLLPGGTGSLDVRAHYEGVAFGGLELGEWKGGRREDTARLDAAEDSVAHVVDALLPFTHGLGTRAVALKLEGTHRHGERQAHWRVTEARTLEPPAPPREVEDFAREYRAMHEAILRDWRAEVVDSAKLAGAWSFEQLAHWLVGGLVVKGGLRLVGAAAPTVVSVLSKGGKQSVQWFRTVLLRTPAPEREALQRLWTKVEAQGVSALSGAERAELQSLAGGLEKSLVTPLSRYSKKKLREWAREEYFAVINPRLARELGSSRLDYYVVHHRVPLEFAQLFPRANVNARANMVGLEVTVHKSISKVWDSLGQRAQRLSGAQVEQIAATIDGHYRRWYHAVYSPSQSTSALMTAEADAMRAVKALLEH